MKIYTILGEVKKSGNSSVFIQIWLSRERVLINTKVETAPNLFNVASGHIKGKSAEIKDSNMIIEQARGRVNAILVKYRCSY